VTISLVVAGIALILLSVAADSLGFDSTPGFGVIQVVAFLLGLSSLTLAGFLFLQSRRLKNGTRSLQADIGIRLAATGLIFCYVSGLSDLIGIGTHVEPEFVRPFVGPLQLGGMLFGILMIAAGMLLFHTSRGRRLSSSLNFLVREKDQAAPNDERSNPAVGQNNPDLAQLP
jgi:hypothetical protein